MAMWELMFDRIQIPVGRFANAGLIRSTLRENPGPMNAANLRRARVMIESTMRKIVLSEFIH